MVLPYQETTQEDAASEFPALSVFLEKLRCYDQSGCQRYLEQMYNSCRQQPDLLPDKVRNEYFKLLSAIDQNAWMQTQNHPMEVPEESGYLWQKVNAFGTLDECHRCATDKLGQYFDNLNEMLSGKKIILDVMRIIQNQYGNNKLFINQIAEQVYMTPNYLSRLFKEETGKTIGTQIMEVRLEESCKLLTQTNMKIQDIVQAIGYSDTNYYTKLFKQKYHLTSSEYRNRFPKT